MLRRARLLVSSLVLLAVACAAPADPTEVPVVPPAEEPVVTPGQPGTQPTPSPTDPPAKVTPACSPSVPRTTPLELAVLPDAGATPFVSVLQSAQKSIRVMVYQMGTGPIIDTLEAKAKAGVKVQIILDVAQTDTNAKYKARLEAAGAQVIWSSKKFTYMHAKMILVDEKAAVVSTGNYAAFRMGMERNYVVTNRDAADVDVLVKLFDADFADKEPDLSCTRLVVSPVNARPRIVEVIASAKKTLLVHSMQLGDDDIREAIAAAKARGVAVRVILADPNWIDANAEAGTFLKQNGIEGRWTKEPGVHVKAISVDGTIAFVGSENMSWTSLTKNREIGVVVQEAKNIATMDATFEKDWAIATPL